MKNFTHLHYHTTFSFCDALGKPAEVARRAKELGMTAIAITDHGVIDGAWDLYFACKKEGIKPLIGCEFYVVDYNHLDSKERYRHHMTVIAKNKQGFKDLCKLVTLSNQQFYYRPRVSIEQIGKYQKNLIILTGCSASPLFAGKFTQLQNCFEKMYFEVVPLDYGIYLENVKSALPMVKDLPVVVTNDCHFIDKDSAKLHQVLRYIRMRKSWDDEKVMQMQPDLYLKNYDEMKSAMEKYFPFIKNPEKALDMTNEIADQVDADLNPKVGIHFELPDDKFTKQTLYFKHKVREGLKKRIDEGLKWDEEYNKRLLREYKIIRKKTFYEYFLIISDMIQWSKANNILVGAGRGSAAGSLICYLLYITEVDPLKYGLIFERFIDITREDAPDIDVDFEDERREDVINYVRNKYKNVAYLSAYAQFKGKNAMLDVARVFGIPVSEVYAVNKFIIQRSGGDSRADFCLEDTFTEFKVAEEFRNKYPDIMYAVGLEGQLRHKSRNAAGVLITDCTLDEVGAVHRDDAISMEGKMAGKLGALKVDILGLATLTVIHKITDLVKKRRGIDIDIHNIDLEDDKVLKGFRDGHLAGIFQYEGIALKSVNRQILPRTFDDVCVINALSRPGPLHCGATTEFVIRKQKGTEEYIVPKIKPITKNTLGVIIYQEQVMMIMREIGMMSWKDTAEIRKLISKSKGVEYFNTFKDKFMDGAVKQNGYDKAKMEDLWSKVCTFGSWAFNLAHSVCYGKLAYQTMYLKKYYPIEYYCCMLAHGFGTDKKGELAKEFHHLGGTIKVADLNKSNLNCTIFDSKSIMIGFNDLKGFGEKAAQEIVSKQPYADSIDFDTRVNKRVVTKAKSEILKRLGVIQDMQMDLFKSNAKVEPTKQDVEKHCPWLIEIDLSKYRLQYYLKLCDVSIVPANKEVITIGVVKEINLRDLNEISKSGWKGKKQEDFKDKDGNTKFVNVLIEDEFDVVLVTVNSKKYPKFKDEIWKNGGVGNIVRVKGVCCQGIHKIFCNDYENLKLVEGKK